MSPCSTMALTGAYNSNAHVLDMQRRINTTLEVKFMDKRGMFAGIPRAYKGKRLPITLNMAIKQMVESKSDPSKKDKRSQNSGSSQSE